MARISRMPYCRRVVLEDPTAKEVSKGSSIWDWIPRCASTRVIIQEGRVLLLHSQSAKQCLSLLRLRLHLQPQSWFLLRILRLLMERLPRHPRRFVQMRSLRIQSLMGNRWRQALRMLSSFEIGGIAVAVTDRSRGNAIFSKHFEIQR